MNANDNPALNIEDSRTKSTICTRKSESMCGSHYMLHCVCMISHAPMIWVQWVQIIKKRKILERIKKSQHRAGICLTRTLTRTAPMRKKRAGD